MKNVILSILSLATDSEQNLALDSKENVDSNSKQELSFSSDLNRFIKDESNLELLPELFVLLCMGLNFVDFKKDFFRSGKSATTQQSEEEAERVAESCRAQEHRDLKFASHVFSMMDKIKNSQSSERLKESLEILLLHLQSLSKAQRSEFNRNALKIIQELFEAENGQDLSLYRCFDFLDVSLGLNYSGESQENPDRNSTQRLFWGSGVAVQSSYSNIFSALQVLQPKLGSTMIDLGCGFGRWGLVLGLLREDMDFVGYEFVPSRVQAAIQAKESLALSSKIQFLAQDLSQASFKLPEADYYYMYDPFDLATYEFLMQQILDISSKRVLSVITKGHASDWFQKNQPKLWQDRVVFDGGNLHIFSLGQSS